MGGTLIADSGPGGFDGTLGDADRKHPQQTVRGLPSRGENAPIYEQHAIPLSTIDGLSVDADGDPVFYHATSDHAAVLPTISGNTLFINYDARVAASARITVSASDSPLTTTIPQASLIHHWTFDDGTATDLVGTADGTLFGGAQIVDGKLALDGVNDYLRTGAIDQTIEEKTLVAWVQLSNLSQRSGGILTLQNPIGTDVFDGIAFAERQPNQWMNSSDAFDRTPVDNGGIDEFASPNQVIMMAVSYSADGTITLYRDGQLYAQVKASTGGPLVTYENGVADIVMGVRHIDRVGSNGTATGTDAFFAGFIDEARIYDAALSLPEIAAIFRAEPTGRHTSTGFDWNINVAQPSGTGTLETASQFVYGSVFEDSNGNGSRDNDESAVSGAVVSFVNQQGSVVATTISDAEGNYRIRRDLIDDAVTVDLDVRSTWVATTPTSVALLQPQAHFAYEFDVDPSDPASIDLDGNGFC